MQETKVRSLGQEDSLEKKMEMHFKYSFFFFYNILAWEIPWTEEPSGVQSKGLQRLGNHSAIKTTTTTEKTWVESTCTPV